MWTRNASVLKSKFKVLGDKWVATDDVAIYFPVYYTEKHLATVEDTVSCVGIVMLAHQSMYAVLSVNTMIVFTPDETSQVTLNDEPMYEMKFSKGSTVIEDIKCINKDTVPYYVYDTFISKGKIPWFLDYDDMCHLFDTAGSYADSSVGDKPEVVQMMVSLIARDCRDRSLYYREIASGYEDIEKRLIYIPMKSVEYGATNTVNRLGGSYMQTGIVSSLINPSQKVENIESILRY